MPSGKAIWKRRTALLVFVAFVVGVPLTLILQGGADDDEGPGTGEQLGSAALKKRGLEDRGLAADYRVPKGWKKETGGGTVKLTSKDRSVLLAIAAPAPAGQRNRVLKDVLQAIRSGYRDVEIRPGRGKRVGGLDAKGAVISAQAKKGERLRILVAAMNGRERTYLVEFFTSEGASAKRLNQAQTALNSLRLRG